MPRITVTPEYIGRVIIDSTPIEKRAELFPDYTDYIPRLYKTMEVPSYVHGYSLAIEYMRNWFLSKFPRDKNSPTGSFFRTIYVNGAHVLDNWKNWNNYNIKREKPMLAIVPTLNSDYDRDNVDMYMGDANILLKRSKYQDSFIKDYQNKIFLYLQLREMEMNFAFRVRVNSRSEQLDLLNKMELWFRVGTTQKDNVSADFHIPSDIMYQIAKDAGFDFIEAENQQKDFSKGIIKDLPEFIQYLNSHSTAPIIFKMRAINQKPEFFVRARNLFTHLAIRDKITIDDGERDGKLDTNYHLEMNVQLHMPVPYFYAYMNQIPIHDSISISETKPALGIYTVNNYDIKPENDQGWPSITVSSYYAEPGEQYIDISELFNSEKWPVAKVLKYDMNLDISPEGFLDVRVLHHHENNFIDGRVAQFHMDYRNLRITLDEELKEAMMYDIVIYADMKYVNSRLMTIENYNNRVESDQTDGIHKEYKK